MEFVWLLKTVAQVLFASSWDHILYKLSLHFDRRVLTLHGYARKTMSVLSLCQVLLDILSVVSLKDAGWSWRLRAGGL